MASRAPPWPAAARSTERSMLISLTAARSRCRTPRRFSNEVLRAPGASASSLLASGSPQLAKAEGGDPSTPAEASSDRSVIRATSSRNSERNHPGTPSEIKSDWRATPFRIRERLRPESAQLGTNGPSRATDWRLHIVEGLQVKIHRLLADLENLAKASADGKSPFVRWRFPVRGNDRRARQIPTVFHVVVDEGLYQQLAHICLVRRAGHRPQLVRQGPDQKRSRDHQHHRGR